MNSRFVFLLVLAAVSQALAAYPEPTPDTIANQTLHKYWEVRTAAVHQSGSLNGIRNAEEWNSQKDEARRQLREMLGLDPMPERTDLKPVITGELKAEGFRVEKLHFQSMPGLYVTANLYLPEKVEKPLPTILYVCGHSVMKKDGVSLGNKTGYHHHGVWFARNGYVCLTIDTLQLGEIEGEHHGTHRLNKWWWVSRGYTPAGVEAWNGIRALDYLESRPEVDKARMGVTGRSGGGAYSWWVAALDERIKAAAPTAGITSLHNHVVDGVVEGHCDCMFMVNTYGWDYDRVIALVAPRPLLICNTDKDPIFPVDGVFQLYTSARRLYTMLGKEANIGLHVAEGPHKDVQPLNTGAFHWFERHLKGADLMVTTDLPAKKLLEPESLRVFKEVPADQRNTRIDHEFVPAAKKAEVPSDAKQWEAQQDSWMQALKEQVFRSWPEEAPVVKPVLVSHEEADGVRMNVYQFTSQEPFDLNLYIVHRAALQPRELELVALHVLDGDGWKDFTAEYGGKFSNLVQVKEGTQINHAAFESEKKMFNSFKWAMAYLAPRGVGLTEWTGSAKAQTHRLRRFYLLGETLESGQVWDIRRGIQALQAMPDFSNAKLWLAGGGAMGVNALYASLFEKGITRLDLNETPNSHMQGPIFFNVLRFMDTPQAAALAAQRTKVVLYTAKPSDWTYLTDTSTRLKWDKNVQIREPAPAKP